MRNSYPLYVVSNIEKVASYLEEKFGYQRVYESDWYIHLLVDEQQLGIMIENAESQPEFLQTSYAGSGVLLSIEVENVDEVYKTFDSSDIAYKLVTEKEGHRHFIVRAPEGILIDVINHSEPEDYS